MILGRKRLRATRMGTALFLGMAAGVALAGDVPGYLLSLEVAPGGCRLVSAAALDTYVERRRAGELDDWTVQLRDASGAVLWATSVPSPSLFSPRPEKGSSVPLLIRVPRRPSARRVVVLDARREEVLEVPLDRSFDEQARAARRRFIELDQTNRSRLEKRTAGGGMRASSAGPRVRPVDRYETMPDEVKRFVDSGLSRTFERLSRFGPEGAGLRGRTLLRRNLAAARRVVPDQQGDQAHNWAASLAVVTGSYTVSGRVRDAATGQLLTGSTLVFHQLDWNWEWVAYLGTVTAGRFGHYSITSGRGPVYCEISGPSGSLYARQRTTLTVLDDATFDVALTPGARLTGEVRGSGGEVVGPAQVTLEGATWYEKVASDATGSFSAVVPMGFLVSIGVVPPFPYVAPSPVELRLEGDGRQDFVVDIGHGLTGTVTNLSGAAIHQAQVLLRHLGHSGSASPTWSTTTTTDGRYAVAVPNDLYPSTFVLSVHSDGYVRYSGSLVIEADTGFSVTLDDGIAVSGHVRNARGEPVAGATIRVHRDGAYLTSATSGEDGSYRVGLAAGVYTFTAAPLDVDESSVLAPGEEVDVVIDEARQLDFTLVEAGARLDIEFLYPGEHELALVGGVARAEVRRGGVPIKATYGDDEVMVDEASGRSYRLLRLYLDAGVYQLSLYPLGCDRIDLDDVVVSGLSAIRKELPGPYLWSGVLRSAEGDALGGLRVSSYDDLAIGVVHSTTDEDGRFAIPVTPNGAAKFFVPETGTAIKRVERFDATVADRDEDCVLDALPSVIDSGGRVTRIFGSESPDERYNLVFLGDGYTDDRESFTDSNGNGMWDGVLFTDLNRNGVYDGGLERFAVYGNAAPPVVGADPTAHNEPFVDLNADGFPNLDDQATYDLNVAGITRSLFGSDVWSKHRDLFNVYRIRLVSDQAGHDILDENERTILARDTFLESYVRDPSRSYLLDTNYGMVEQLVNEYTPFADTVIVLMNQPVPIGRANSYILMAGGLGRSLANPYVISHEMGHNVGHLADEYTEFPDTYEGPERPWANVTTFLAREQIPWRDFISSEKELPSVPLTPGVGLYEGAYYRPGGAYRPTAHCAMGGGRGGYLRFCPVCVRHIGFRVASLRSVIATEVVPITPLGAIATLEPAFSWSGPRDAYFYRIEIRRSSDGALVDERDVYGTRFMLGGRLSPGVAYQWRLQPRVEARVGAWTPWWDFSIVDLAEMTGVVPGVASVEGLAGSDWHSDLWVHNAGEDQAVVWLFFARKGRALGRDGFEEVVVGPAQTVFLHDVVNDTFAASGSGALFWKVVTGNSELVLVEGTTYSRDGSGGRYGQRVSGVMLRDAAVAGSPLLLPVAQRSRGFRTNLDFVTDAHCTSVRLVVAESGRGVVAEKTIGVEPYSWYQLVDIVSELKLDPMAAYWVELSGFVGGIIASGSAADDLTNDATRLLPRDGSADDVPEWLLGIARLDGRHGSVWRSDITLANPFLSPMTLTMDLAPRGTAWGERQSRSILLEAGSIRTLDDVVGSLFSVAKAAGVMRLSASSAGVPAVFARTYGQSVAVMSDRDAITPVAEGRIVGVNDSNSFRTNLLLQNIHRSEDGTTFLPTTVNVELLRADGTVAARAPVALAAGENVQIDRVARALMGAGAMLDGFVIRISIAEGEMAAGALGGVLAAASEADGGSEPGTNDPRLVPARLVPAFR